MANDQAPQAITGHFDPEGEAPWVMQLVVHVEKSNPPTRTDACEAAASAVVRLLNSAEAAPGGDWHEPIERWASGRIRKHCRRARGSAWEKVLTLPGVTVEVGTAQVRAFVPCATDNIPAEIARLQLSGLELPDPAACPLIDPLPGTAVVVSICPEPFLSLGKAASAAAHAAQVAALRMPPERLKVWASFGFQVKVEHPDLERWQSILTTAPVKISDAGFTEVTPGTVTSLARWS